MVTVTLWIVHTCAGSKTKTGHQQPGDNLRGDYGINFKCQEKNMAIVGRNVGTQGNWENGRVEQGKCDSGNTVKKLKKNKISWILVIWGHHTLK